MTGTRLTLRVGTTGRLYAFVRVFSSSAQAGEGLFPRRILDEIANRPVLEGDYLDLEVRLRSLDRTPPR